jgi:hypothetical protein
MSLPVLALPAALLNCGKPPAPPPEPARPRLTLTDDQFLDQLERASFQFFWEQSGPSTGLVKDRALAAGGDARKVASIAATGFGLTGMCIAHKRGYGYGPQIEERVRTILWFILHRLPNIHGFFHHFINTDTGTREFDSEVSSIDTAILLCGVLACRQYFRDAYTQGLANQIYRRVNWRWMLHGGYTFCMGWTPEKGFILSRWDTYSELMMLYLLAIGSPTYHVPAACWDAFTRPVTNYKGIAYIYNPHAPLFIHQYSHAWFDFRGRRDQYSDYFENSVRATQAHKLFCLSLQEKWRDYQPNLWGITASDSAAGYVVWGGPPAHGPIDGTIVPCATGGSLPFAPADCIAVLRNIREQYPRAWQRYGFVDAFNPLTNWYDEDVIGIDAGITLLMAENQRSSFVWDTFMTSPEAQTALRKVGLLNHK